MQEGECRGVVFPRTSVNRARRRAGASKPRPFARRLLVLLLSAAVYLRRSNCTHVVPGMSSCSWLASCLVTTTEKLVPVQRYCGRAANAGATLIAIIAIIRATTVINTRMRFICTAPFFSGRSLGGFARLPCLPYTIGGAEGGGIHKITGLRGMGANQ